LGVYIPRATDLGAGDPTLDWEATFWKPTFWESTIWESTFLGQPILELEIHALDWESTFWEFTFWESSIWGVYIPRATDLGAGDPQACP